MMWRRPKKVVESGEQNITYEDTTWGIRRLSRTDPGVATVPVDLDMSIEEVSWITGVDEVTRDPGSEQGFRDGLIMPSGSDFLVLALIYPEQSIAHRFGMPENVIDGKRIGRFPAQERRRWLDAFDGRNVKGVLFIDVPTASVEFRFRPDRIGEGPATDAASPGAQQERFCGQCGSELRPGVQFCTRCGSPLSG